MLSKRAVSKTQEIVGNSTSDPNGGPVPEAWLRHHRRLLQLREKILGDTNELQAESNETLESTNLNAADTASDRFDRELALSLLSFEQDALSEIDAAIERLRKGTYGVCEVSGKLIPRERLEAIPWARYTVEVQAESEKSDNAADARSLRTSVN